MPNAALRARVVRLVANDIRLDDLTNIFLYIRNGCPSETIREIGDFVAHSDVRTKGLVTDAAKDWLAMFEYQDWIRSNVIPGRPADLTRRPPNTIAFLKGSFRHCDKSILLEQTGLTPNAAKQALQKLQKQFKSNSDNTLRFTGVPIGPEYILLAFLSRFYFFGVAFSDETLFADLKSHLLSLRALERKEVIAFDQLKPVISLFALSKMHNVVLKVPGRESQLVTRVTHGKVGMLVKIEGVLWGRVFSASLNAEQYCEPDLFLLPQPWECDIEVTSNLKLGKLA